MECSNCNGLGEVYVDESRYCREYIGTCCMGCGHDEECSECNGTGNVEQEE